MEKLVINSLFVFVFIGITILVLRYWNKQILKKFQMNETNSAYSLFLSGQMISIFLILLLSFDLQGMAFLESMEPFGKDFQLYWSIFGVLTISIIFIYAIGKIIALILYKIIIPTLKDWQEQIYENNWSAVLPVIVMTILISSGFAYFTLRPFLYDWISNSIGFIPLN